MPRHNQYRNIRIHVTLSSVSCNCMSPFNGALLCLQSSKSLQRLSHCCFKATVFLSFSCQPLCHSSRGESTNVTLKSKEDGSGFSNYSRQNYSNYTHWIIFILYSILSAHSEVHSGPLAYASIWEYIRWVPIDCAWINSEFIWVNSPCVPVLNVILGSTCHTLSCRFLPLAVSFYVSSSWSSWLKCMSILFMNN